MSTSAPHHPRHNVLAAVIAIVIVFLCGYLVGSQTTRAERDVSQRSEAIGRIE